MVLQLCAACGALTWLMCRAPDGGYGGSDTNYRYSFILPDSWKSDTVSKVDKATNGTDVRYSDPSSKGSACQCMFATDARCVQPSAS